MKQCPTQNQLTNTKSPAILTSCFREYEAVLRVDPEQPADYIETDGYYLHQSPQGLSRCQVVDLYDDGRVRVDFVDEGRRATVDQDELIDLPRTFWDFPEFAVLCTMNTNDKCKVSIEVTSQHIKTVMQSFSCLRFVPS